MCSMLCLGAKTLIKSVIIGCSKIIDGKGIINSSFYSTDSCLVGRETVHKFAQINSNGFVVN